VQSPQFPSPVYLKRTCSRVTSASSALGVLNDYALYKSTHSLTTQMIISELLGTEHPRDCCAFVLTSRRKMSLCTQCDVEPCIDKE